MVGERSPMAARARRLGALASLVFLVLTAFIARPDLAQAADGAHATTRSHAKITKNEGGKPENAVAPAATGKNGKRRTVVVVTGGLRWDHLDHASAPKLAALGASGAMANLVPLSTRGAPCPVDTWLAISAGRQISERAIATTPTCAQPPVAAGDVLPNWDRYTRALEATDPKARLGRFARSLHRAGVTTHSIGDGGAYVLANKAGDVPTNHTPNPLTVKELGEEAARSAKKYDLTIVDADAESYASDEERDAARQLFQEQRKELESDPQTTPSPTDVIGPENPTPPDTVDGSTLQPGRQAFSAINTLRVESILERVPPGTRVVVMSTVDIDTYSYMQLFVMADVSANGRLIPVGLAGSDSVRHGGLIQMLDVVPTLFTWIGADRKGIAGSPISVSPTATSCEQSESCYTNRVEQLADQSLHANKMRTFRGKFVQYMTWAAVGYFFLSLFFLARRFYASTLGRRRPYAKLWRWAGLTLSALPMASLVINYFKWWDASSAYIALFGGSWVGAGLIAALVLPLTRFHSLAPLVAISSCTAALVAIDAATGSNLMADSPVGFNLLTAARFYGIGNEAYALLASGAIISLAFLGMKMRRWGNAVAAGGVLFFGLGVAAIDALPSMGADFGGVLSFVPALGLMCLLIAKLRLSWRRILVVGIVTVGAASAIALVDWMRPAESRTHLGRFVQSIADGELFDVIARKLGTNIRLLSTSTHRWVVLAALLLFFLCLINLLRPSMESGRESLVQAAQFSELGTHGQTREPSQIGGLGAPGQSGESGHFAHTGHSGKSSRPDRPGKHGHPGEPGRPGEPAESGVSNRRSRLKRMIAWARAWGRLCCIRLKEWTRKGRLRAEESWGLEPLENSAAESLRLALTSLGACMALGFALNDSGIVLPGMAAILVIPGIVLAAIDQREGGQHTEPANLEIEVFSQAEPVEV